MSTKAELACVYASLILVDISITGEKISSILKVANVDVEPYWPTLFAKALEVVNAKEFITDIGFGIGSGAPAAGAAVGGDAAPASEAKKEEKKKEEATDPSDDDMGFALFDYFFQNAVKPVS